MGPPAYNAEAAGDCLLRRGEVKVMFSVIQDNTQAPQAGMSWPPYPALQTALALGSMFSRTFFSPAALSQFPDALAASRHRASARADSSAWTLQASSTVSMNEPRAP